MHSISCKKLNKIRLESKIKMLHLNFNNTKKRLAMEKIRLEEENHTIKSEQAFLVNLADNLANAQMNLQNQEVKINHVHAQQKLLQKKEKGLKRTVIIACTLVDNKTLAESELQTRGRLPVHHWRALMLTDPQKYDKLLLEIEIKNDLFERDNHIGE